MTNHRSITAQAGAAAARAIRLAEVDARLCEGATMAQIATEMGVSRQAIYKWRWRERAFRSRRAIASTTPATLAHDDRV